MLSKMRSRLTKDESGFTLIELMVVVLIIAILVAIAVPTFLNQRQNAQNRSAQSDLRNALSSVKAYYAENQDFTETVADMQAIEPNLDWGGDVFIEVEGAGPTGQIVCLSVTSGTGNIYAIYEDASSGTQYGVGSDAATPTGDPFAGPTCPAGAPGHFGSDVDAVW